MARLLSGRVGVTSFAGLSTDRNQIVGGQYTFLGLAEAEPNLGLPGDNDQVLIGDADGTRRWDSVPPSGSVSGITVQDEGITPVGFAGSVTIMNFVGAAVTAIQTKQVVGGLEVGVATIRITTDEVGITLRDEGELRGNIAGITSIDFVGAGVTVLAAVEAGLGTVRIEAPGLTVQDEGTNLLPVAGITTLNFVGTGVTASTDGVSGIATITIDDTASRTFGVGVGSFIGDPKYDIEYLNQEIGLDVDTTIDDTNMPFANKAWCVYEQFNINAGTTFTIGDGKTFIVDLIDLASV